MTAKNLNTSAIAGLVADFCRTADALDKVVADLKPLVSSIKSKSELRDILIVHVAAYYKVGIKTGQRGTTFESKHDAGQARLRDLMNRLLGTPAKASVEIEFEDKDVKAMQALLKRLETYADYEVDGKKVGAAKALALLVAEAKDRI